MKNKYIFLFGLIGLIALLALSSTNNKQNTSDIEVISENSERSVEKLNTAGHWILEETIVIDGNAGGVGAHNWTWAVAQEWCSGAGTEADPFLIENASISVDDASNPGLKIMDNATVYITLSNVTVTNSNVDGDGVWIEDCANITIINCDFSNNGNYGLYMINVNTTSITSTNCIGNSYGIYMDNCVVNTLTSINCSENAIDGIDLINCTYNEISSSYFQTNGADGVYIEDSDLNILIVETADNNRGIILIDSDYCNISNGQYWDNTAYGIVLTEDDGDTDNNTIAGNLFSGNGINAVDNSTGTNDWDGNEWGDYQYYDGNDDGIGDIEYDISGSAGAIDSAPIFSDGAEPLVELDDEDDVDDLFEDEKTAPKTMDTATIALIVGLGVLCFVVVILLYLGGVKAPIRRIKRSGKKIKSSGKKFKRKIRR